MEHYIVHMKLDMAKLLEGTTTYPNWSSGRVYPIQIIKEKDRVLLTYKPSRKVQRYFSRYINITPELLWALGFIEGEGSNSLGKSAYARFMVTNSNPDKMLFILDVLDKHKILERKDLKKNSIRVRYGIMHNKEDLSSFWKSKLRVSRDNIYLATKPDPMKKSKYGTCDIYMSDAILRIVIDRIRRHIFDTMRSNLNA